MKAARVRRAADVWVVYTPTKDSGQSGRMSDHHTFFDHVDDVARVHAVEEEDAIGFAGGKDPGASRDHLRIFFRDVARTADAERERHVAGSPFGEADAGHLEICSALASAYL